MTDAPNTGSPAGGTSAPPATGGAPPAAPNPGAPPAAPAVVTPWDGAQGIFTVQMGDKQVPWYDAVPEEPVRQFMAAKQYANPSVAAVALYNANKMINGASDVLAVPGKDADAKAWDAFYTKLGRPEKPDGYEFKFAEGQQVHEPTMAIGKEIFHMLGATPEKAQAAAQRWNEFVSQQQTAVVEANRVANENALKELETSWGADLNANKAAGDRVMKALLADKKYGMTEQDLAAIEGAIGVAPLVKLLAAIGKRSEEGTFTGGVNNTGDPNDPNNMSPEAAKSRIATLQADAEFQKAYTDNAHPGHKQAVDQMVKLFARSK